MTVYDCACQSSVLLMIKKKSNYNSFTDLEKIFFKKRENSQEYWVQFFFYSHCAFVTIFKLAGSLN